MSEHTAYFKKETLTNGFFPSRHGAPFGDYLGKLFFDPRKDNEDFPIHGPNVIRLTQAICNDRLEGEPGLLAETCPEADETRRAILNEHAPISEALGLKGSNDAAFGRMASFLKIAALYHDIGKTIRRANHPQIGSNLLRNFDQHQSDLLVQSLQGITEADSSKNKHSRFSLICSITQHHDKFGVVSTGEGAMPIFSDILLLRRL